MDVPIFTQSNTYTYYQWMMENQSYIEETLKSKDKGKVFPIIITIGEMYKSRDGSKLFEMAPLIALALREQPEHMLTWFSWYPSEFNSWNKNLPAALLTDILGNSKLELEERKQNFEKKSNDEVLKRLARTLINTLKNNDIRVID